MSSATDKLPITSAAGLPGPRGLPLLGNALEFRPSVAHQVVERWAREYGPWFTFRIGPERFVGVADPDAVRTLLMQRPAQFSRTRRIESTMREMGIANLFSAEGEQWQRYRRVWLAAMNAHRVKPFFERMVGITERLRQRWLQAATEGRTVDVVDDLMRYTVDVVTLFAYGHDANTLQQGDDIVQQHLRHVFPAINRRINSPWAYWRYLPLPADWRLRRALRGLNEFGMTRIAEVRERMAADPSLRDAPDNLLTALIAAGQADEDPFTDHDILGNTLTALLAGEDTTALSVGWMIHELAGRPEQLERLRAEVDAALGDAPLWTDPDQRDAFPYLDAVMQETMRLRPVAPIQGMTANEDVELGGRHFPARTNFMMAMRALSLNEEIYPEAQTFRPERWLEGRDTHFTQKPPHPFGGGKRTCPGMNLALLEIRSVIAMLVRHFDFQPPPDARPVEERFAFTMRPENLRMQMRLRA
ncbi:MAG: cytochrome P450 [Salinisphaeraceae bacterium]